jgi:hypothetical protein
MRTGTLHEDMGDTRDLMNDLQLLPEKWALEEEIGHNL